MDEFFAYVAKEQPDLKFNEKEYQTSEKSFLSQTKTDSKICKTL
jgi:hypothetical protein